jgi:5-bromo-4-chloroindolyl phosphate hydrolysis protein
VRGYAGLADRDSQSAEVRETLERAETSLDAIQRAFDKQLAGLLQHEVIDLDSEVALLEKTVQMDDLMNSPAPAGGSAATTGGTT